MQGILEENIARGIFNGVSEKSYLDKILGKNDVDRLRELVKKDNLTRSDMMELQYLLSATESKLLNYGEWERYVMLKLYIWVREFIKTTMFLYDYRDKMTAKDNHLKLDERTVHLIGNCARMMEHNVKFMCDLYLNIGRTSLSLGATGFLETLKNKYEIAYPTAPTTQAKNNDGGLKVQW